MSITFLYRWTVFSLTTAHAVISCFHDFNNVGLDAYDLPKFSSHALHTHNTQIILYSFNTDYTKQRIYKYITTTTTTVYVYEDYNCYINHNWYALDYLLLFIEYNIQHTHAHTHNKYIYIKPITHHVKSIKHAYYIIQNPNKQIKPNEIFVYTWFIHRIVANVDIRQQYFFCLDLRCARSFDTNPRPPIRIDYLAASLWFSFNFCFESMRICRHKCFMTHYFEACVESLQLTDEMDALQDAVKQLNGGQAPHL